MHHSSKSIILGATLLSLVACTATTDQKSTDIKIEQNHGYTAVQASVDEWWNIPYPTRFNPDSLTNEQSFLKVDSKNIVDGTGKPFVMRGVNIADIDKLAFQNRWNKGLFEVVADWGSNTVRIPIHPMSWRKRGKEWYFEKLDQAVAWANSLDMYIIIDWHSIGNLKAEMYQHPMYVTDIVETREFWRDIAFRYKNVPTMAVYEIFNEPTDDYIGNGKGSLGKVNWEQWRTLMEDVIDIVQVYDDNVISLVAGFNWAYDLSEVTNAPIRRDNIAYAIHPYPQKEKLASPTAEKYKSAWEDAWGYVADSYPIIATELGWVSKDGKGAHVPVIHDEGVYGPAIIEYMSAKGISYTAWVFDPDWSPTMIDDWNYTPSEQGAFFKKVMQEAAEK